ncbi:hypothetical protein [Psychroserpens ponticola]|uniref:DUF998 domain-containing protein n=1 Tax=Psychroserpens ponticola TaxID=2932268 RepID=A0ABY7S1G1_9FLAO|nr:hypothetical protein [Psychroserpens ponticola]WCO02968.1 hypothetical protein MUN68_005620 [Psychroserpens ponticola]
MSVLINQLKTLLYSFLLIFVVGLILLGTLLGIHFHKDVPLEILTNDLAVIGELPIYAGFLSQVGILLWSAAAAICMYSVQFIANKEHQKFIKASVYITMLLGLDDAFMFHETLFPSLGIHQKVVFLCYGIMMLVYLYRYYKLILTTDFILFIFALGWFGISMLIDNCIRDVSPYITKLAEDGTKFIGIVTWLVFFARTCKKFQEYNDLKST